jgi:hypothetical protein
MAVNNCPATIKQIMLAEPIFCTLKITVITKKAPKIPPVNFHHSSDFNVVTVGIDSLKKGIIKIKPIRPVAKEIIAAKIGLLIDLRNSAFTPD